MGELWGTWPNVTVVSVENRPIKQNVKIIIVLCMFSMYGDIFIVCILCSVMSDVICCVFDKCSFIVV